MLRSLSASMALLVAVATTAPPLFAEDEAAARTLYQEAHKLVKAGEVAKGCAKFEESLKLKENLNARFFLADCYEKLGRTASAWTTFLSAASKATAAGEADKATEAKARAAALEPKLARLQVKVTADVPGLVIKRDDVEVGKAQWDTAVPIDPGSLTLTANAPGKKTWSEKVTITAGETATVTVPALEGEGRPEKPVEPGASPLRTVGLVAGGVGLVTMIGGVALGLSAKSHWNESNDGARCVDDRCTPEGLGIRDEARSRGNLATVVFVAGSLVATAGVVLFVVAPKAEATPPSGMRSVRIGVSPSSFRLQWSF